MSNISLLEDWGAATISARHSDYATDHREH
jgi:hypothetical protein